MSDAPATAGALLRRARQAQGLHIAALAASIKVVPRKLELLEADRFDELPDPTFTRALAHTVCRALKVDPAPILALLPPPKGHRLEHVSEGLNTPFRERPGRLEPKEWAGATSPLLWLALVLVIGAATIYLIPAGWLPSRLPGLTRAPVNPTVVTTVPAAATAALPAPQAVASGVLAPAAAVPAEASLAQTPVATETEAVAAASAAGVLQMRATAPSWVDVTDARGQSLLTRVLQPGENVGLDGVLPLKVRIGNASGTQVTFRGQALELAAFTRDNVAQLHLK